MHKISKAYIRWILFCSFYYFSVNQLISEDGVNLRLNSELKLSAGSSLLVFKNADKQLRDDHSRIRKLLCYNDSCYAYGNFPYLIEIPLDSKGPTNFQNLHIQDTGTITSLYIINKNLICMQFLSNIICWSLCKNEIKFDSSLHRGKELNDALEANMLLSYTVGNPFDPADCESHIEVVSCETGDVIRHFALPSGYLGIAESYNRFANFVIGSRFVHDKTFTGIPPGYFELFFADLFRKKFYMVEKKYRDIIFIKYDKILNYGIVVTAGGQIDFYDCIDNRALNDVKRSEVLTTIPALIADDPQKRHAAFNMLIECGPGIVNLLDDFLTKHHSIDLLTSVELIKSIVAIPKMLPKCITSMNIYKNIVSVSLCEGKFLTLLSTDENKTESRVKLLPLPSRDKLEGSNLIFEAALNGVFEFISTSFDGKHIVLGEQSGNIQIFNNLTVSEPHDYIQLGTETLKSQ